LEKKVNSKKKREGAFIDTLPQEVSVNHLFRNKKIEAPLASIRDAQRSNPLLQLLQD
jgi:hypothetical protein